MVSIKVADVNYRWLPLIHRGIKISVKVDVQMEYNDENKKYIIKCEALINEYYKQPVQRQLEDATAAILEVISLFCNIT